MRTSFFALFITVFFLPLVSAQFGDFFEHMFHGGGGGGQGRQRQQQQQQEGAGGMWANTAEQVACSRYLCPTTLHCVTHPTECPCPTAEDIKCLIPDGDSRSEGTVVCVRGEQGCLALEKMLRL